MAKTYEQIAEQIKALQQQADALKRKEVEGVIGKIKTAIAFYGLTAADLGFGGGSPAAVPGKRAKAAAKKTGKTAGKTAKRPSVIRYRDENGNSWTGMGPKPRWIAAGLAGGKNLGDFAVPAQA